MRSASSRTSTSMASSRGCPIEMVDEPAGVAMISGTPAWKACLEDSCPRRRSPPQSARLVPCRNESLPPDLSASRASREPAARRGPRRCARAARDGQRKLPSCRCRWPAADHVLGLQRGRNGARLWASALRSPRGRAVRVRRERPNAEKVTPGGNIRAARARCRKTTLDERAREAGRVDTAELRERSRKRSSASSAPRKRCRPRWRRSCQRAGRQGDHRKTLQIASRVRKAKKRFSI